MKTNEIELNVKTVGQRLGKFKNCIVKFIIFELFKSSTVQKFKKWQQ